MRFPNVIAVGLVAAAAWGCSAEKPTAALTKTAPEQVIFSVPGMT